MELTMKGFYELSYEECFDINGGVNWGVVAVGALTSVYGIGKVVTAKKHEDVASGVVQVVAGVIIMLTALDW